MKFEQAQQRLAERGLTLVQHKATARWEVHMNQAPLLLHEDGEPPLPDAGHALGSGVSWQAAYADAMQEAPF